MSRSDACEIFEGASVEIILSKQPEAGQSSSPIEISGSVPTWKERCSVSGTTVKTPERCSYCDGRQVYGAGVKLQLTVAVPAVESVMTPLTHMSFAMKSLGV